jgi:HAE1 family hydrophobic/amphiphilic exporter-1
VALFGFLSLGSLKQELIPSFASPQAAIVTSLPGASPEIIDQQISQPIETAVRALSGLTTSSSTSQANISIVRVAFDYGISNSKLQENLTNAVAGIKSTLPTGSDPKVVIGSFDSVPIISLGVSSLTGSNEELGKTFAARANEVFGNVSDLGTITVAGIATKRLNLTLNTAKMTAAGLSQQSIVSALTSNGLILPGGTVNDSQGSLSVQIGTAVNSVADVEALPLLGGSSTGSTTSTGGFGAGAKASGAGAGFGAAAGAGAGSGAGQSGGASFGAPAPAKPLTIGDVAKVKLENAPITTISRVNGKDALSVSFSKAQNGNTVALSSSVLSKVDEFKTKLGGNVDINTIFDQAPYVKKSIDELTSEGLLGLGFAIVIILLFLLSVRPTLVTAISIPTSVLIAFIGLGSLGYSLNLFTLSALTIAIGRVVDDSIVVIENINRHLSYGEEKKEAILNAVREVAGAITAATITTVAVFLPISLVGGLIGELFRPFGFTFTVALLASLLVALTIVPVLAYWFLKPKHVFAEGANLEAAIEKVREDEEARERKSWLQRGYLPVLRGTQRRPWITVGSAALVLFLTFGMAGFLKTDFIGSSGSNGFLINQTLKPGASIEEQSTAAAKLETVLDKHFVKGSGAKDIESWITTIGSSGDGRVALGGAAGGIQLQVTSVDGVDSKKLQDTLTTEFAALTGVGTIEFASGNGQSVGGSSSIDINVLAPDDATLEKAVNVLEAKLTGISGTSAPTNTLAKKQRTLQISVNRPAAAALGLSEIAVTGQVATAIHPSSLGSVNVSGISTPVYVVKTDLVDTVEKVKNVQIMTLTGPVVLSKIASVTEETVPASITTQKGNREATVSLTPTDAKPDLGKINGEVSKRLAELKSTTGTGDKLPAGATIDLGGVTKQQADSFSQLGLALLAAIAIVFIVMVATFGSIIQPLILLVSIPFASTGAIGLLLITDTALGVPAIIGMLLLVGVVVTNAIVLIDLINQYRKQGRELNQAIMDGARQRLRPILMTALATIFALIPMAIGLTGSGGFISKPLAIVVIGGLFSSTILTLVIVPVLYELVESGKIKRAAKRAAKKAAKGAKPAVAAA